jgi:hypothetical protein
MSELDFRKLIFFGKQCENIFHSSFSNPKKLGPRSKVGFDDDEEPPSNNS